MIKRSEPVLTEFLNRIKRFESYTDLNEAERVKLIQTISESSFTSIEQEYASWGLGYESTDDLKGIKEDKTYKLNVRNVLGVKAADDWIFNLNIGNVMHLAAMALDELSFPSDITHELNKDAMLEKIILSCTAYFCLGTEIWFLSHGDTKTNSLQSSLKASATEHSLQLTFPRSEADMWHA